MTKRWRNLLIGCAALLAACVGDQKAKNGAVQLINAVADGPRLSLFLDGTSGVLNADGTPATFDFRAATGLLARGAGPVHIAVQQVIPPANVTLIDLPSAALAVNDELTLIVVGKVADSSVDRIDILNKTTAVPAGEARLQFVHAAAGFPAVDVYVTDNGVASLAGLTPVASLAFKTASARSLAASTSTGRIRLTGAGDPAAVLFDSGPVALPPEGDLLYTIIENVGAGSGTYKLALNAATGVTSGVLIDQAVPVNLRIVHGSPDTGAVDVSLQDTTTTPPPAAIVVPGLSYRGIDPGPNAYREIGAATYTIRFIDSTDNTTTLFTDTGDAFTRGGSYTLILDGLKSALGRLVVVDDVRRVGTEGRVRVINQAPSASTGALDLYVVATGSDLTTLTPQLAASVLGSQTGYLSLVPGSYDIIATATGSKTDIRLQQTLSVAANKVYSALIVENTGGGAPLGLLGLDDYP